MFQTIMTVAIQRTLLFVIIDDNVAEIQHRVMDAKEIAAIAHKRGISAENVYFEECNDGFINHVRTLIQANSATTLF